MNNGLESFSFHSLEPTQFDAGLSIEPNDFGIENLATLDSRTAAEEYLKKAISSKYLKDFNSPQIEGNGISFEVESVQTMPLTNTKVVKFREYLNNVSVYGSSITVELDENKQLLSIFSAINRSIEGDSIATVSPSQAISTVEAHFSTTITNVTPLLYFYHVPKEGDSVYRLVYLLRNVVVPDIGQKDPAAEPISQSNVYDCVVDAHTGEMIDKIPKEILNCLTDPNLEQTHNTAASPAENMAAVASLLSDDIKNNLEELGDIVLEDTQLNISTFDFKYKDILDSINNKLPGTKVTSRPPPKYRKEAMYAHDNTKKVAEFIKHKLKRYGIDNEGMSYVSTVNCCNRRYERNQWPNAAWIPTSKLVVYGQTEINGELITYASSLDTVSHEIFHGIICFSSKLESRGMAGALNESYCDIFGILISNYYDGNVDWNNTQSWNWELGEKLTSTGKPLRDMSEPNAYGYPPLCPVYPAHMDDYKNLPVDNLHDWGGIHINSNIHNKAAYNLISSGVFTPDEMVYLFYNNMVTYLSKTSTFADSLVGLKLSTRTMFRNGTPEDLENKIDAVTQAFAAVGIVE